MKNRLTNFAVLASSPCQPALPDYLDPDIDWTPDLTDPDASAATKSWIARWCSAFPEHFRLVEIFTLAKGKRIDANLSGGPGGTFGECLEDTCT